MTEPIESSKKNIDKKYEIIFEQYECPSANIAISATLASYAYGMNGYGTYVDVGGDQTQICCLYEGIPFKKSIKKLNFGGNQVTQNLCNLLSERGYNFQSNSHFHIANEIKEKLCYVALDYQSQIQNFSSNSCLEKKFELPDGEMITLGNEMIRCTEIFFNPKLIDNEEHFSLQNMIHQSILCGNIDSRRDLYRVNLYGGSCLFKDFEVRLKKELSSLLPSTVKLNKNFDSKNHVWIGASILSSLTSFQPYWVSKTDYHENGFNYKNRFQHYF